LKNNATFTLSNSNITITEGDLLVRRDADFRHNFNSNSNLSNLLVQDGNVIIENQGSFNHWGDNVNFTINGALSIGDTCTYYDHRGTTTVQDSITVGHHSSFQDNHRHLFVNNGGFFVDSMSTVTINFDQNWQMRVEGDVEIGDDVVMFINRDLYINNGDLYLGENVQYTQTNGDLRTNQGNIFIGDNVTMIKNGGDLQVGVGDFVIPAGSSLTTNTGGKYVNNGSLIAEENSTLVLGGGWYLINNGSLDIHPNANFSSGNSYWRMRNNAVDTFDIRTGGNEMRLLWFETGVANTVYNLQDDLLARQGNNDWGLWCKRSQFNTNGHKINVNEFRADDGNLVKVDFTGTDTLRLDNRMRITTSGNLDLNMGSATILFESTDNFTFTGGNRIYNDVVFNAQNPGATLINITGNNTFGDIKITADGYQNISIANTVDVDDLSIEYTRAVTTTIIPTINLSVGTYNDFSLTSTQEIRPLFITTGNNTFNSMDFGDVAGNSYIRQWRLNSSTTQTSGSIDGLIGTCPRSILINSNNLGSPATISVASGIVEGDFLRLQDNTATGGATFNASNTLDFGNVSGWNFTAVTPEDFYWIGDSGNWDDPNAWSFTSGGAPAGCVPTRVDNVFFDDNSFSGSGQFCNANVLAECNNMTWNLTTVSNSGINGNQNVAIFGSLKLDQDMNFAHTGEFIFESFAGGETIETEGVTMRTLRLSAQGQACKWRRSIFPKCRCTKWRNTNKSRW